MSAKMTSCGSRISTGAVRAFSYPARPSTQRRKDAKVNKARQDKTRKPFFFWSFVFFCVFAPLRGRSVWHSQPPDAHPRLLQRAAIEARFDVDEAATGSKLSQDLRQRTLEIVTM